MIDPAREEIIFSEALLIPPGEREKFLRYACGDDAALQDSIEALLAAHEEPAGFLDAPVTARLPSATEEVAGDRIGRYKLLQKLGEGGHGVVYLAEQIEPVRRQVAIKVIKLGMDTKAVIARFEAERQALAMMDHPNIAKVFDAGATESGRPYFAMEVVRGISITRYCDENELTTRARIRLFIQVCHAIQHAHQKGIIHRDIKPSNILISRHDAEAGPKVIDFGIAKATQGRLTDQTVFTSFDQFIGTPAYTSPEQANVSDLDIDTRSDVYGLGVLLYELLTGHTPFDGKVLAKAGLAEIRRQIREVDPPRPSARLSTMDEAALEAAARQRQTVPSKLIDVLHGDLDWIVMRCLEKDRRRRYDTANDLARDLERHLDHEPVTARPPTTAYRLRKTIQRHKLAVAAISAVTLAILGGLGVATWAFIQEKAAREHAVAAEQRAVSESKKSEQVARFLQTMLEGIGPSVALGRDTTLLREIADRTTVRLDHDLRGQPAVEAELRETLGKVYFELGDFVKAKAMHEIALELRAKVFGRFDAQSIRSLRHLALVRSMLGDTEAAEAMLREALSVLQRDPNNENIETAATMSELASVLLTKTDIFGAEREQRAALTLGRKFRAEQRFFVGRSMSELALSIRLQGDLSTAEETARAALEMQRKARGDEHPEVAHALYALSLVLYSRGRFVEAESTIKQALNIQHKTLGPDHPSVASSMEALAAILIDRFQYPSAEVLLREGLAINRKIFGETHPRVARTLYVLSYSLLRSFQREEAEKYARMALEIQRQRLGNNHLDVADTLALLSVALFFNGHPEAAETAGLESLGIRRGKSSLHSITGLEDITFLFRLLGKRESALALTRERVELLRKRAGAEDRATLAAIRTLSTLYYESGDLEAATPLAEHVFEALLKTAEHDDPELEWSLVTLSTIYIATSRAEDAVTLYEENASQANFKTGSDGNFHLKYRLCAAYRAAGRYSDARKVAHQAIELHQKDPNLSPHLLHGILFVLGEVCLLEKKYGEAETYLRKSLGLMLAKGHAEEWVRYNVQSILGMTLAAQNKTDAEPTLLEAHAGLVRLERQIPIPSRYRLRDSAVRLADLYGNTGRPEKAREWQQKAAAISLRP